MSFRGINTTVIQIRRAVFTEVARMAYANVKGEEANHMMRSIPYKIIPGEEGKLRKDIFLERAIVEERVRLAIGLPTRRMDEHNSVVSGLEDANIADKYYDPPLVNVIKFACNRCPEKMVKVSDLCQGCLAHPCMEVCPKNAIVWESGRSTIDQEKCIKCGRCVDVCPYHAIVKTERPCATACGMGAIHSDALGRAEIDYSKCVSCGQCLVNCPFGAIADKGQIYQLIQSFNRGDRVYALVAPAFVNQFPALNTTQKLRAALAQVGFCETVEVAIGADLCTVDEARDFLKEVPDKLNFMATSCCPAWSMMAKTLFPDMAKNISMTMTPMVFTARMIKAADPEARMCFIGPCAAKKLEASRRHVRSDVDFVLTFEELAGIMEAPRRRSVHRPRGRGAALRLRRRPRLCPVGRRGQGCGRQDPRVVPRQGGQDRLGRGPGQLQEDADDGQGRQVQRLPAGRHGLPGRLHRRRRHHRRPRAHRGPAEQVRCRGTLQGPRGERVHHQHPPAEGRPRL